MLLFVLVKLTRLLKLSVAGFEGAGFEAGPGDICVDKGVDLPEGCGEGVGRSVG